MKISLQNEWKFALFWLRSYFHSYIRVKFMHSQHAQKSEILPLLSETVFTPRTEWVFTLLYLESIGSIESKKKERKNFASRNLKNKQTNKQTKQNKIQKTKTRIYKERLLSESYKHVFSSKVKDTSMVLMWKVGLRFNAVRYWTWKARLLS